MEKEELSGISSWKAPFIQTTKDVAQAVASVTPAVQSPRPSVVYSSKEESSSQLQRLQHHVSRILKGLYNPSEVKKGIYNPEILTSQKRQWADFQLQSLDHRVWKEPSKLFESMVVVGLPPNSDIRALHDVYISKKSEVSGRFQAAIGSQHQSHAEPCLEPQVLFVYPPEKQLPLNYKDLISFCFPAGVEVNSVERTPSMSEISEILLGQEHLKQSDHSFVFRLQAADNSTLYGCCILVKEIVQKPSGLISMISDGPPRSSTLNHCVLTTKRCYCIISRVPFLELHFGVLNSILTEERLNRLTKQISFLDLESPAAFDMAEMLNDTTGSLSPEDTTYNMQNEIAETPKLGTSYISGELAIDKSHFEYKSSKANGYSKSECYEIENLVSCGEPAFDSSISDHFTHKESAEKRLPNAVLPFLRYQRYESSESSSSFQDSPHEDRHFRSDIDEEEIEVASSSGRDTFSEYDDVLAWAKANSHGSLQIICKYYQLPCPARGSTIKFDPLDHLQPLEYHRPRETFLTLAGSAFDFSSCNARLELAEAQSGLVAQEEATALSVWTISCLCGSLRLDHVLTLFAAALLEKHIVVICPNLLGLQMFKLKCLGNFSSRPVSSISLSSSASPNNYHRNIQPLFVQLLQGILSTLVLSIIPLIRPYQWQSLLMPVLPDDMVEFLDAPVPYIVGVINKTIEVQSKLTNAVVVDASKNQVKSTTIPQLPQHRELYSRLSPFHAKLVGESYLGKRRPVYDCTDVQVEAAQSFLGVLRSYLDSLCSNIRSHTITDVQSNDDKVSLLLKESFIESFPSRDRPFMELFLDTQLFSVHTDFVLSFFQKD